MEKSMFFGLAAILALALASQAVAAPPEGKGGRGSVSAATVCELDDDNALFKGDIVVCDKTSGNANVWVASWDVEGRAKTMVGNWMGQPPFGTDGGGAVNVGENPFACDRIHWAISLCEPVLDELGNQTCDIHPDVAAAKALNALTMLEYGHQDVDNDGNPVVVVDNSLTNMCGDDPTTPDVVEQYRFPLDQAIKDAIAGVCRALNANCE